MRWIPHAALFTLLLLATTSVAPAQLATDLTGGVLIAHTVPEPMTCVPPPEGWCALCELTTCEDQENDEVPLMQLCGLWYVVAAFLQESEWCGVEFGLAYPSYGFVFVDYGICAPDEGLEIPTPTWPASGSGTAIVTTTAPWQGNFQPVYWFGGYSYYGGLVQLTANPGSLGDITFANCDLDEYPAACFGGIGFGNTNGVDCCPTEIPWACCLVDGTCLMVLEEVCLDQGGYWYPLLTCEQVDCNEPGVCCVDESCFFIHQDECSAMAGAWHPEFESCGPPNPCDPPVPIQETSWGALKSIYR